MKRFILLLAATVFFTACANKSITRYEALAPVFEHNGCESAIAELQKQCDDLFHFILPFFFVGGFGLQ